jgi:hypothetical protein
MASPIEGIAGLGLQLTRQPDGTLQVQKLELEPRSRRRSTLLWTVIWNAMGLFFTAGLYGWLPGEPEVLAAPGVALGLPPFFALTGLSSLHYLIWTRLGREEWLVGRNRLEVRQSLLGFRRWRRHADAEVVVRRYYQNTWALEVGRKPQRLILAELEPAKLAALFELGEFLARETGWTLRAPERPSEAAPRSGPAVPAAPHPARQTEPPLSIDPEQRRRVEPDLEPGERLLWTGQADAKRVARQTLPVLLIGIPWTVFSLFGAWPWSWDRALPGLFVLFGLVLCATPAGSYFSALQTLYAVTDRRILILTEGKRRKLEVYRPADLCETERQELPDGSGDLLFARRQEKDSDGGTRTVEVKFVGVPQVRAVERLLRQLSEHEV